METATPNRRFIWFVLWGAFTLAPLVYSFVGLSVAGHSPAAPSLPLFQAVFPWLAVLQIVSGSVVMHRAKGANRSGVMPAMLLGGDVLSEPADFQTRFIIGAAMIEACAIEGFILLFLGAPLSNYPMFGGAALAVMLTVGLSSGLAYWRAREDADAGMPPST